MRNAIRLFQLLFILALSNTASAALSLLDVQFSSGNTEFYSGEIVAVTAMTDPALEVEYRFELQQKVDNRYNTFLSEKWSVESQYIIDVSGLNLAAGEYRLVTRVREVSNRTDMLVKYSGFTVNGEATYACAAINGKTFTNYATAEMHFFLNSDQAATAGSEPGYPYPLGREVSTIHFDNGLVFVMPVNPSHITYSAPFIYMQTVAYADTPLLGQYNCSGDLVFIDTSGEVQLQDPSVKSAMGIEHFYYHVSGVLQFNPNTGELVTAGTVFRP